MTEIVSHQGIQQASYFAARATIQTATVIASALGFSGKNAPTFRNAAYELMIGELRRTPLNLKVVDVATERSQPVALGTGTGEEIHLVLTPLDGAEALRDGSSGSMTAVAAATREGFRFPDVSATGYFVVAIGPERVNGIDGILDRYKLLPAGSGGKSLRLLFGPYERGEDATQKCSLIDDIVGHQTSGQHVDVQPLLAVTQLPKMNWRPLVKHWHRHRRLRGSALAAALAAFTGRVPYAVAISLRPQLIQMAIAARALGGRLLAIPIDGPDQPEKPDQLQVVGRETLTEADLVTANNGVLVCTSISEICVMSRVRFGFDFTARADTLIASISTSRLTQQTDELHLGRANFRDPNGNDVNAAVLMQAFRRVLEFQPKDRRDSTSIADQLAQMQNLGVSDLKGDVVTSPGGAASNVCKEESGVAQGRSNDKKNTTKSGAAEPSQVKSPKKKAPNQRSRPAMAAMPKRQTGDKRKPRKQR